MKIKPSTVARYLERYAEPCVSWLQVDQAQLPFGQSGYESAVLVPIFDEDLNCLDHVFSQIAVDSSGARRLAVAVVNQPNTAPAGSVERNRALIASLLQRDPAACALADSSAWFLKNVSAGTVLAGAGIDLLLVDATTVGFCWKAKDGVGRARKIAGDLILALYGRGLIRHSMAGCTDADARLPVDYFRVLETEQAAAALLFPFRHVSSAGSQVLDSNSRCEQGMAQIEASFRYYVLGLAYARSPCAYHSLGSAIAFDLPHYAAVRGFPNRQAGEDFYLLAKLAQLGPLLRVQGEPVALTTRVSNRVPFGTGPRLERWLSQSTHEAELIFTYDPQVFVALRGLLNLLLSYARFGACPEGPPPNWLEQEARTIFRTLQVGLSQCASAEHRVRRVHEQFDALATLRWVRRLTEQRFPEVELDQALFRIGLLGRTEIYEANSVLVRLREWEDYLPGQLGPAALFLGPAARRDPFCRLPSWEVGADPLLRSVTDEA